MAQKTKTMFICNECGYETVKWMGKCPTCGSWDSFEEQLISTAKETATVKAGTKIASGMKLSAIDPKDEHRFVTNISELDRVLGGGIVKGSVVRLSGDPGIGKSTILMQICNTIKEELNILKLV